MMIYDRFTAILFFIVSIFSSYTFASEESEDEYIGGFYRVGQMPYASDVATWVLRSNICKVPQLFKAYIDNGTYVVGASDTASKADAYILAEKGRTTDTFLRGDQETMRLESLIADTLTSVNRERTERVSLSGNEEKFKTDEKIYNSIADKFTVMKEDQWWDYTGANTIFEKLKRFGQFTLQAKINDPLSWNSPKELDENEIKYIQDEYYEEHKNEKSNYKEVKIIENPVISRFLHSEIAIGNKAREKDLVACRATAFLALAYKMFSLKNRDKSFESEIIQENVSTVMEMLPQNVAEIFQKDFIQYGEKIKLFWEKKVFPLLSTKGYFADFWKENLPKPVENLQLNEAFAQFLQNQDYTIRGEWRRLSQDAQYERIRAARSVIENGDFVYENSGVTKNQLESMLTLLPPNLSRMFDKSLGFLPKIYIKSEGNQVDYQRNMVTIAAIKKVFDGYKDLLTNLTKERIVTFAESLPISPYYPRLNVAETFEDVLESGNVNLNIKPLHETMPNAAQDIKAEFTKFFNNFDYYDENKSNYLDVNILRGSKPSGEITNDSPDEIKRKLFTRIDEALLNQRGNLDYHLDHTLKMLLRKFFVRFIPTLKDFNANFTTTQAGVDFITRMTLLLGTIANCHGGQGTAVRHAIVAFYGGQVIKPGMAGAIDQKVENFIKDSFEASLPFGEQQNAHHAGSMRNNFTQGGYYNAGIVVDELNQTSFQRSEQQTVTDLQKFVTRIWGTAIPDNILSLVQSKQDLLIANYLNFLEETEKKISAEEESTNHFSGTVEEQVEKAIGSMTEFQRKISKLYGQHTPKAIEDILEVAVQILDKCKNNPTLIQDTIHIGIKAIETKVNEKLLETMSKPIGNSDVERFVSFTSNLLQNVLNFDHTEVRGKRSIIYPHTLYINPQFLVTKTLTLNALVEQKQTLRPILLSSLLNFMEGTYGITIEPYFIYGGEYEDALISLSPKGVGGITLLLEKMGWMYRPDYHWNFSPPSEIVPQNKAGAWTKQYEKANAK